MEFVNAISSIKGTEGVSAISSKIKESTSKIGGTESFESLLDSVVNMVKETDGYSNAAEQAELEYALGLNDNVHDLLVAQQKANITLQYTVAVRNAVMDAYRELMQLQF